MGEGKGDFVIWKIKLKMRIGNSRTAQIVILCLNYDKPGCYNQMAPVVLQGLSGLKKEEVKNEYKSMSGMW